MNTARIIIISPRIIFSILLSLSCEEFDYYHTFIIQMKISLILGLALLFTLSVSSNIQQEEVSTLPKLPIYVGIGYNLVTGNPLDKSVDTGFAYPIFKMTYKNQ